MINEQLSLRRFRLSDHKEYRKARSESELVVSAYFEVGLSIKTSKRSTSYEFIQRISGPDRYRHYAIFWGKTLVGQFSLYEGTFPNSLQIVYWIRTGYEGLGIATWALSKVSNNLFKSKEVSLLELFIDVSNLASMKVALKCNYVYKPLSEAPQTTLETLDPRFGWFVLPKRENASLPISNVTLYS
jgi:RimJ/RimL family protein N-acetyltransferase